MIQKRSKAKQTTVIAMTAALLAIFFYLSKIIALPNFTFLYLPIILLGVFPLWFGWDGLVGSAIGAFIGAVYVENLPFYLGWVEITTAIVIYAINWLLIPKIGAEAKTKRGVIALSSIYAASLFIGTCVIIWQFIAVGLFPDAAIAWAFLVPTFALNLPIVLIACPALLRSISPKLKTWGMYSGSFTEWRNIRAKAQN